MLKQVVPEKYWPQVRQLAFEVIERSDRVLRGSRNLIPPRLIQYVGGKDQFIAAGEEFFAFFKVLGGLKPTHSVLDIGCGMGRMALPLTRYLRSTANFVGFDIVPHAVMWCQRRYSDRYANFRFEFIDVQNDDYNPNGHLRAATFEFPYVRESFDFVFATSVFTHLRPADAQNYLTQTARVLKPGSKALLTFFVMNDEAREGVRAGKSHLPMVHQMDGFYTISRERPEAAVAYETAALNDMLNKAGLKLEGPIHFGNWCGRSEYLSYQDILIVSRNS